MFRCRLGPVDPFRFVLTLAAKIFYAKKPRAVDQTVMGQNKSTKSIYGLFVSKTKKKLSSKIFVWGA
jgi:hypothetical protein